MDQFAKADGVDQPNHASTIRTGKLEVNLEARRVTVDGQAVHLTDKEYGILELLSLRKGTTSTKEMFLAHLYRGRYEPELKIIDVFVCKLRKKLTRVTGGSHSSTRFGAAGMCFETRRCPMTAAVASQIRASSTIDRSMVKVGKGMEDCATGPGSRTSGDAAAHQIQLYK
jgi:hypothetical protein